MNTAKKLVDKYNFNKPKNNAEKAAQAFLNGETDKQFDKYSITNNELCYYNFIDYSVTNTPERFVKIKQAALQGIIILTQPENIDKLSSDLYRIEYKALSKDIIAKRLPNGEIIGNSSILSLIGKRNAFGNEVFNREETEIQRYLSQYITMIPFSVFQEAKLDINSFNIIERGQAETIERKVQKGYDKKDQPKFVIEKVHFTGASLFNVGESYFLFDIDRREVEHQIFNPFLVTLPKKVNSIKDAYNSLMPVEVKKALLKGLKVMRQGEWFFIPKVVDENTLENIKIVGINTNPDYPYWQRETMRLQAGNNSPNYAQTGFEFNGEYYVRGKVEHSGREHADLFLNTWHRALPNTSIGSFTIVGDID